MPNRVERGGEMVAHVGVLSHPLARLLEQTDRPSRLALLNQNPAQRVLYRWQVRRSHECSLRQRPGTRVSALLIQPSQIVQYDGIWGACLRGRLQFLSGRVKTTRRQVIASQNGKRGFVI